MDNMTTKRKSLETTKGRRPKPMVIKAGATNRRTAYKCGGKAKKK